MPHPEGIHKAFGSVAHRYATLWGTLMCDDMGMKFADTRAAARGPRKPSLTVDIATSSCDSSSTRSEFSWLLRRRCPPLVHRQTWEMLGHWDPFWWVEKLIIGFWRAVAVMQTDRVGPTDVGGLRSHRWSSAFRDDY